MDRIPYVEYLGWLEELRTPKLTDKYLMAIRHDLVRMFNPDASGNLSDYEIEFRRESGSKPTQKDPTIKSKAYIEDRQREAMSRAELGAMRGARPDGH